MSIMDGDNV